MKLVKWKDVEVGQVFDHKNTGISIKLDPYTDSDIFSFGISTEHEPSRRYMIFLAVEDHELLNDDEVIVYEEINLGEYILQRVEDINKIQAELAKRGNNEN